MEILHLEVCTGCNDIGEFNRLTELIRQNWDISSIEKSNSNTNSWEYKFHLYKD